nr:hypothetical protein [Tanacetum cinerariifolium]
SHKPKFEDTNQEKLYLLHMDLCGPMRVKSVNEKKYIFVIVDDYSRFTWVKFLRLASLMKHQLLALHRKTVSLKDIIVLIKAARTMLIYAQALLFLWAEAVATACYTKNRSIVRLRHGKTPYELLDGKLPDLSFLHVFDALYYPTNDSENLEKLQPKADIGKSHKPKFEDTNQEKLYLLHMDLCGPMRVKSVNEKKYIFVIVDDYSRFTWVKFLRSKDEAPDFIITFLKMIQVRINVPV